jgi:hypothetical protein
LTETRHTGIQLIAVTNPFQANLGNVVECNEIVVSRHTVDGLDADLLKSSKEVLTSLASALSQDGA